MTDAPGLITDGFLAAARAQPDKVALICGDQTLSYGELAAHAARVAARIDQLAARRVAIARTNDAAVIELFLGVTMAGAVAMMFEPLWPRAVLDRMRAVHEPHLIFDDGTVADYAAWRDAGDAARALLNRPTPDMPFLMGFTSGTTGTPKAFIRSHASWTASFAASARELGTSSHTTALIPGPLSHGLSLYAAIETLYVGGTAVLMPAFDAVRAVQLIGAHVANTVVAAPTVLDLIADAGSSATATKIITAGAKLTAPLRQKLAAVFSQADVIEYYGASELSFVTVAKPGDKCPPTSVGRAFANVAVAVRRDDGTQADVGEVGTVWVKSNMLSSGYVGPVDGTGFRTQGGWATVGDRGSLDARGFLTLAGREGDMIITGGLNVYPSEVEAVLASLPGVREAAVVGQSDERWGQVVTAIVAGDGALTAEALKSQCREHLAPYKVPRRWYRAESFDHTVSGKIDRAKLLAALDRAALKPLP
ncbi:MAG: AMP-binding protein [Rhodospirillaceae bacterium]|nr:AMP-binding protein [Rhodospirillaceae bacterium]